MKRRKFFQRDELAANRAKMAALTARCAAGGVKPIVVPAGVYFRNGAELKKVRISRRRFPIDANQIRLWHEEYLQRGETLQTVAERHGISRTTLRNRFRELRLDLKSKKNGF